MRSLIFFLLGGLIIGFSGPASLCADESSSYPILSSQHKFSAEEETDDDEGLGVEEKGLVLISRGTGLIKRRPQNYGTKALAADDIWKKISAKSAVVMDAQSGEIVWAHLPDLPGQPASTIKILTGLISIDSLSERDMVPVSRAAARMPRSKIYLRKGHKYPANDLINAVLLASANDASVALAEKIAGSEKVFAQLMTAKAKSLGAVNTVCKTSSGLTASGQKSTARDLALIFKKAMENKDFAEKLLKRRIKNKNGGMVYSHNKALWQIPGTVGGKTGYTYAARQTYVGKFKRGDTELVVAFLGSEKLWSDARKLVEYGFTKQAEVERFASYTPEESWPTVKLGGDGRSEIPILLSNLRK